MNNASEIFSVNAMNWKALVCLLVIAVLIPLLVIFFTMRVVRGQPSAATWFAVGVILLVGFGIFAQLSVARLQISGSKLLVGGGLYSISVDRAEILKDEVRLISGTDVAYRLSNRTNGVGLPGFALGWFQLSNGKKVFALTTEQPSVLIPTKLGYDIITSPADRDRFISSIRTM